MKRLTWTSSITCMREADAVCLTFLCMLGYDYDQARVLLRWLKWWVLGVAVLLVAGLVSWVYLIWRYILS